MSAARELWKWNTVQYLREESTAETGRRLMAMTDTSVDRRARANQEQADRRWQNGQGG